MINFRQLKSSFRNAFRGINLAFGEQTLRILFVIAAVVSFFVIYLPLTTMESAVLVLVIAVVLSLEMINSQIERILDILKPDYEKEVGEIKDISAGAVLVISIGAVILGMLIILPYLL